MLTCFMIDSEFVADIAEWTFLTSNVAQASTHPHAAIQSAAPSHDDLTCYQAATPGTKSVSTASVY